MSRAHQFSWISRKAAAIFVIAIIVLSAAAFTGKASAAPGVPGYTSSYVINQGNNGTGTCTNTLYFFDGVNYTFIGYYVGSLVLVMNSNQLMQHCTMKLAYGPGVLSRTTVDTPVSHQVYNTGGVATLDINISF